MKIFKALIVTLSAILLTGCYTQLQYSQRMNRITDEREVRSHDQDIEKPDHEARYYGDEYIPVYYKNYEYSERWAECGCNPYRDFYDYDRGFLYNRHNYYRPYYGLSFGWSPFNSWSLHHRYFGSSFAFSMRWGSPYYHSFFYDPFFYSPFYHSPLGYGLRPVAYNYFYFYNGSNGYYDYGNNGIIKDNRRYGPRSIGTSRVSDDNSDRTRDRRAIIDRSNSTRSRTIIRSRSTGSSRSRGTVDRTTDSSVSRSRGDNDQSSRMRSRGNLQRSDSRNGNSVDRSRSGQDADQRSSNVIRSRTIDWNDNRLRQINYREEMKKRLKEVTPNSVINNKVKKSRSTFFQRLKGFFDSNSSRVSTQSNRSNRSAIRVKTPSLNNRSIIRHNNSSNNRSSVTRSRSSSSNSSRSRGSSGGSGSSDRSRGN